MRNAGCRIRHGSDSAFCILHSAFDMLTNVPLAPLPTLGIGGPAKFFIRAESVDDVREALAFAGERQLPVLILAGGSNVLIPDEGFAGLVIHLELRGITIESENAEAAIVNVAAEVPWADRRLRVLALDGDPAQFE